MAMARRTFSSATPTRILLRGKKDEIQAEVEQCMAIGKQYPGFFLAVGNHIPANTPVESVLYYNDVYAELQCALSGRSPGFLLLPARPLLRTKPVCLMSLCCAINWATPKRRRCVRASRREPYAALVAGRATPLSSVSYQAMRC